MTKDTDQETGLSKTCTKCGETKDHSEFNLRFDKQTPRPRSECRDCQKIRTATWRESPEGIAREEAYRQDEETQARIRANRKIPERLANDAARHKRWRETPEGKVKLAAIIRRTQAKPSSKAKRSKLRKRRYREDPKYHCDVAVRSLLGRVLKAAGLKKSASTFESLGYTADQFRQRIECQFLPGMTWENRAHDTWHIDHKKPVAAFLRQGIMDPKTINALCNLRPAWAAENMSKGDAWPPAAANDNSEADDAKCG